MKHFLKETDFGRSELEALFRRAREFKATRGRHARPLEGQISGRQTRARPLASGLGERGDDGEEGFGEGIRIHSPSSLRALSGRSPR